MDNVERALEKENARLREVVERLRRERAQLLDVKSTDGLSSSEWMMRTAFTESEVKRLTLERDEAREWATTWGHRSKQATAERDEALQERNAAQDQCAEYQLAANEWSLCVAQVERERDEWRARSEVVEADNAKFIHTLNVIENDLSEGRHDDAQREAIAAMEGEHPGSALLEERRRIAKTLDTMDVPSEADEQEMGRACDFAGRVELLGTWGQRGWREYRRLKDTESALLEERKAMLPAWERLVRLAEGQGRSVGGVLDDAERHAALLERLRAAGKVVEAWRVFDTTPSRAALDSTTEALMAYDALKDGA